MGPSEPMQTYRPNISQTVERRAQEAAFGVSSTVPEYADAKPAKKAATRQTPQPSHSAALTRRERRVKDILLKELNSMYKKGGGGLTYSEIQHLEKTLNVDFIDRELEQMVKQERTIRNMLKLDVVLFVMLLAANAFFFWQGDPVELSMWMWLLFLGGYFFSFKWQIRSLQRKRFIYEALRELTDADEMDVTLDRVAREADALIEQIVERELALDQRYPVRPFVKA